MLREIYIVVYHDLSDEKNALTGQLSLSTRPEVFRNHIAYFSKNFDFIGINELLTGSLPRKPLLLTFDDAYRSVLTVGGPILREVNAPSLFFIIPSVVQGNTLPVDNVLSFAVEKLGMRKTVALIGRSLDTASSVSEILHKIIAKMSLDDILDLKARIFSALKTTENAVRQGSKIFLSQADMDKLADYGIAVGNHSMTHSHFHTLSMNELDREIREGRTALESLSGQPVRCLSIPYGDQRDATEQVMATARSSGHEAIFLVHAKSNLCRYHNDIYYRISMKNESNYKMRFSLKVFPLLRSIRDGFAFGRLGN